MKSLILGPLLYLSAPVQPADIMRSCVECHSLGETVACQAQPIDDLAATMEICLAKYDSWACGDAMADVLHRFVETRQCWTFEVARR